jgi:hypothetical protein
MDQIEQEFGKRNPNAPAALSRFEFLIGRWRCEAKIRLANGEWQILPGNVARSRHPRRLCHRGRIPDGRLRWRTDGARPESPRVRCRQANLEHQMVERISRNLDGPWAGGARWRQLRWSVRT